VCSKERSCYAEKKGNITKAGRLKTRLTRHVKAIGGPHPFCEPKGHPKKRERRRSNTLRPRCLKIKQKQRGIRTIGGVEEEGGEARKGRECT